MGIASAFGSTLIAVAALVGALLCVGGAIFRLFGILPSNYEMWNDVHNGLINIALADGHAKAYSPTQAIDACTADGNLYWRIGNGDCDL